ncbi:AAA family ATPase [Robinsoniella peoriensis]|uniref:AAA family ATPase n=1 Tax=Robinsoniella peoriensis TaxID=180332 RepID=UPI00085C01E1|nr:TOPRIM nucleotidyl transferase/hydrolase domain-containing protein [Robinsoniella peoriensis]
METISIVNDHGTYKDYDGLGYSFASYSISGYERSKYYGSVRPLFVAYLNTLNRLTISNPANLISRKAARKNPIHHVAFDRTYREWLSDNFKQAFGKELIPHTLNDSNIPLCIGDAVKFNKEFVDEQVRQEEYASILDTYKQVQEQGDGIKSFTGILLYLMLDYYCTFLIDEPESFLHPPQANIMGRIIGETLRKNQQAFISTHSEEIIKGLLDVCPERVKIIRIIREEEVNEFSVLENDKFNEVWSDPLLKYSNIMSSLFHKKVILCESDSDCKLYSIIENHIKKSEGTYSETLFIHCGGKHRMAKIATALRSLNINVRLVTDIDVINDDKVFKGVVEAFDIEWESIQKDYNIVVSNLHSSKEEIERSDAKTSINRILDGSSNRILSKRELKDIRALITIISKWDNLKKTGIYSLPAGDATSSFKNMDQILRTAGIYVVPLGELECFIKEVGGHGPEWSNLVLETYPDLNNEVYDEIKKFVKEFSS